jgi:hypothetical protein
MYVGRDFDVANPTECEVYSIDFGNGLQSGESINVASITMTVFQGLDSNPSSHLSGSPAISLSGTVVSQRRIGGSGAPGGNLLAGVTYTITYTVTTNLTNVITLYSRIPCRSIN